MDREEFEIKLLKMWKENKVKYSKESDGTYIIWLGSGKRRVVINKFTCNSIHLLTGEEDEQLFKDCLD